MSTFVPSGKNIDRKWYVVDASGQTLGRLATKAASVLSGKLTYAYSEKTGTDCSEFQTGIEGMPALLPCQLTYSLTGTRVSDE